MASEFEQELIEARKLKISALIKNRDWKELKDLKTSELRLRINQDLTRLVDDTVEFIKPEFEKAKKHFLGEKGEIEISSLLYLDPGLLQPAPHTEIEFEHLLLIRKHGTSCRISLNWGGWTEEKKIKMALEDNEGGFATYYLKRYPYNQINFYYLKHEGQKILYFENLNQYAKVYDSRFLPQGVFLSIAEGVQKMLLEVLRNPVLYSGSRREQRLADTAELIVNTPLNTVKNFEKERRINFKGEEIEVYKDPFDFRKDQVSDK